MRFVALRCGVLRYVAVKRRNVPRSIALQHILCEVVNAVSQWRELFARAVRTNNWHEQFVGIYIYTDSNTCIIVLSTHADRQGVDISVTVCVFVCLYGYRFLRRGVIFCTAVHQRPRHRISHFGELYSPRSPKSDELAGARTTPTPM